MSKHNLYFFQPQHANVFQGQPQYWLPYTAGVLWAYANQFEEIARYWHLGQIFWRRDPFDLVLEKIHQPKVCAFSTYVWNTEYNLRMSQLVKQKWPECTVIFGGPQINGSWLKHEHINCLVLNEGERSLVDVLQDIVNGQPVRQIYSRSRMDGLECVPSPYGQDFFDALIQQNPNTLWSASLETNRGCPYSCTFCDWGGLTQSKIKKFPLCRVRDDIEWLSQNPIRTVFITDANFGIFKDRDREIASMIGHWAASANSKLEYVSVTYAKNSNKDVFEIAKEFGPVHKGVTFSVQSMNDQTLMAIKRRNMSSNDIAKLIDLSSTYDINHYTELIIGLPEETMESWKHGMCQLLEIGQHHRIEVHFNNLLENTEMRDQQMDRYGMTHVMAKNVIPLTDSRDIVVDEFFPIVTSTRHMNTKEMVESYMYSWMIIHLHLQGYTNLLARYLRYSKNIAYRDFYDVMFDILRNDRSTLNSEYRLIEAAVLDLLTAGEIKNPAVMPGNILFHSQEHFYQNLEQAVNLGENAADYFGGVELPVIEIQRRWLFNDIWTVPFTITCDLDIYDWSSRTTEYAISAPNGQIQIDKDNLLTMQRRGKVLYNTIKEIV